MVEVRRICEVLGVAFSTIARKFDEAAAEAASRRPPATPKTPRH